MNQRVIIAQTRGVDFVDKVLVAKGKYEIDTVLRNGNVETKTIQIDAVGTLGTDRGRSEFMQLPHKGFEIGIIGLGVTEAGIHKVRTK